MYYFLYNINYKKNNKDVDLVRKYLLSNVYELDNLNEYIAYFEKSASSINDSLGIAIAKMAYFWDLYMTDLELAHKYNQEALEIYVKLDLYARNKTILIIIHPFL